MTGTSRHDYERYYDPPRAALGEPGVFRARVWYRVLLVAFSGGAATLMLSLGLLFLIGLPQPPGMSPAENRTALVIFTAFGLVLGTGAVLFLATVVARRGPALRAFREGLEVRLVGPSKASGVPSTPNPLRLMGAFLTGRPCRLPTQRIPWASVVGASVLGGSLSRDHMLAVHWRPEPAGPLYYVGLPQWEITAPVGEVAAALSSWANDEKDRAALPGWGDPNS